MKLHCNAIHFPRISFMRFCLLHLCKTEFVATAEKCRNVTSLLFHSHVGDECVHVSVCAGRIQFAMPMPIPIAKQRHAHMHTYATVGMR